MLAAPSFGASHTPDMTATFPPRVAQTLFVALDAVPHTVMAELYQRGWLADYQPPVRVVSAFPSITTTGFTGLFRGLGAGKADGYDAKYFDYATHTIKGTLLAGNNRTGDGYQRFFDILRSSTWSQVVMYTAPFFAARRDLARLQPLIWAHPARRAFFCYIGSTDATAHLDGKTDTIRLIQIIVGHIAQLREQYAAAFGQPLEIVLFSDHGFHWDHMRPLDIGHLRHLLRQQGLRLTDNLHQRDHVAAVTWGNISGADLYALPEQLETVADILLRMEGTDLVLTTTDGQILVQAPRHGRVERALIRANTDGTRFAYEALAGDPLGYLPTVATLRSQDALDQLGFADARTWFAHTHDHPYPDALFRIWDAFHGLAHNPAPLLLSTLEHFEFGDNLTRFGAWLRGGLLGTHGALAFNSSNAFLMTTDASVTLPPVMRYDEALVPFRAR